MTQSKTSNSKIALDLETIGELADLLNEKGLSEIEIKQDGVEIKLSRKLSAPVSTITPTSAPAATAAPVPHSPPPPASEQGSQDLANHPGVVTSPMVGTAYLAPEPGAAPFVNVGTDVREGQTLMIIEAMKTMNHIPAPRAGKVTHILVENGSPVEYGDPLVIIE